MKKIYRVVFMVVALIVCCQLAGIEEAFCQDSAMETGCTDCLTCIGHQFAGLTDTVGSPRLDSHGFVISFYYSSFPKSPSFILLRPPISR
jgi:hypothetical protein